MACRTSNVPGQSWKCSSFPQRVSHSAGQSGLADLITCLELEADCPQHRTHAHPQSLPCCAEASVLIAQPHLQHEAPARHIWWGYRCLLVDRVGCRVLPILTSGLLSCIISLYHSLCRPQSRSAVCMPSHIAINLFIETTTSKDALSQRASKYEWSKQQAPPQLA